jgi:hypothetical protein
VGNAYAGVPFTVTVAGGRPPYALGSSEPSIFPVPAILNENIFTVLPGQPGVTDTNQDPNVVPSRTVALNARDTNGGTFTANYSVLQNFLLGYGVSYTNSCEILAGQTVGPSACSGRESAIRLSPTFNGLRRGNVLLRFERVRGDFTFTQCGSPPPVNPAQVNTITINTDHEGIGLVCLFVPAGSPTQNAVYRIIDVSTGVYVDELFIIDGSAPSAGLTVLPSTLTFTGRNGRCGVGSSDVVVFDGTPPFTATSTNGAVAVTGVSNTNPGRFTITLGIDSPPCATGVVVAIVDAFGRRGVITVDSIAGAAAPAITVAPAAVTLTCGQSATVTAVGGAGLFNASSTNPAVIGVSTNSNLITISQLSALPTPSVATRTDSVNVTDGFSIATITVTSPATCT